MPETKASTLKVASAVIGGTPDQILLNALYETYHYLHDMPPSILQIVKRYEAIKLGDKTDVHTP